MSMTRQEQLDAVVRNYGVWAENKNHLLAFWNCGFVDYVLPAGLVNGKFRGEFYCFTRAEVEQRKAELQSKPSWDDAPDGAKILVFCPDNGGWIFGSHCNASPVGIECEWSENAGNSWHKTSIVFCDGTVFLTSTYELRKIGDPDVLFRPIQTDREKWIDKALHVEAEVHDSYQPYELLEAIYDAGLAKMPD